LFIPEAAMPGHNMSGHNKIRKQPQNVKRNQKRGQCRIIAGKWRGRKISFDDAEGLRPTTDRIRETVFNWLQPYLSQSRCLDCFAGSGVLGFEALSRGAESVVFLEQNKKTVNNLKKNIDVLDAVNIELHFVDTLQWLTSLQNNKKKFDVVFLDPPFATGLLAETFKLLGQSGCMAEGAIIYLEHNIGSKIDLPGNWCCLKQKEAGQVAYKLLQC
jgi:16S rRNA (guanine966-N2)-methyltransferase